MTTAGFFASLASRPDTERVGIGWAAAALGIEVPDRIIRRMDRVIR